MTKKIWRADRLSRLGSSIFAEVAEWKKEARALGHDVIDLSIGSPDLPPSEPVRQALSEAVLREDAYAYPSSKGSAAFMKQAAEWLSFRFGIVVDPESEMLPLMGSQDGLGHLALSLCNPGDIALVPDPGYPVYAAGLALAGVEPYPMPLREENGFLPDFEAIPDDVWRKAKFMLLNYPSNPVSAVADLAFFTKAVTIAKQHGVLVVHDLAYSEMAFDGYRPPSILQVEGAKEAAVEFHSLSKSFNMAGCRIGFLAGSREAVGALRELKANIDYGVFLPVQEAAITALRQDMAGMTESAGVLYEKRRDAFLKALGEEGWQAAKPKATMFVWAQLPTMCWSLPVTWDSRRISREMLSRAGVAVIPGDAFGTEGEGYVRIALVESEERLIEAARRIGRFIRGE
ncbi:aminotransferase class I/II-fold pyridoxal phosphate-dependent enzyme [Paenibacillus sp. sptzw28]|uniref:aminotransferase class I/II-fold pyridoxal phosphate-dependent enzyme n=1 Tax=Paenibacillus sp. sptzw28 TaxID=715179 RepID=UPI001C6F156F|nr:aminotransferase class I/II-fold pyridoxal phosphate-dependent enzyme [Paenibacillus sp. sptzw28]QYR22945.1 aminotransferase class I/II-fold pyridoxal phosphate-dependent enzyme [Paenibacillus sp. sptzw28]